MCDVTTSHCLLLKVHSRYGAMSNCSPCTQQQSKVCIQACALLYIAAFCCTPNCHGIMSQLITENHVIKFERNSFRVQLSARGIADLTLQGSVSHGPHLRSSTAYSCSFAAESQARTLQVE